MKQLLTLYWNELKGNKIILLFIIIAAPGSLILLPQTVNLGFGFGGIPVVDHIVFFSAVVLLLIPLLFFTLIIEERQKNTNYHLFSLPINRSSILFSKFLVFLSYILFIPAGYLVLLLISSVYKNLFLIKYPMTINQLLLHLNKLALSFYKEYFQFLWIYFAPTVFLLAGIMCVVEAFNAIVKNYRLV